MASDQSSNSPPTLSEVTEIGRKVLKYLAIGLVSYMILRMVLTSFVKWWRALNPPPPPPPTVGFGKLPLIDFPEEGLDQEIEYKLETAQNRLPSFPDRAKVFEMPGFNSSLLADERVRGIARMFGFDSQPQMLDANTYRWFRYQPLEMTFEIELDSKNFSITSDYLTRPELLDASDLLEPPKAVTTVKNFLSRAELLPKDVATASGQVEYLKALGGESVSAVSLSDADFIRVDLDRVPVDEKYNMFTPGGTEGIIRGVIAGNLSRNDSVVALEYRYQPVDYSSVETYPLRSVNSAWKEFSSGEGYAVNPENLQEVVIRDVILGYFDAFQEQEYLQPIYVFIGDQDFIGYIPAISAAYYLE